MKRQKSRLQKTRSLPLREIVADLSPAGRRFLEKQLPAIARRARFRLVAGGKDPSPDEVGSN
jgi:hypothetical protein